MKLCRNVILIVVSFVLIFAIAACDRANPKEIAIENHEPTYSPTPTIKIESDKADDSTHAKEKQALNSSKEAAGGQELAGTPAPTIKVGNDKASRSDENNHTSADQHFKEFINKFFKTKLTDDAAAFKESMDEDGIYSITYFVDGRDRNRILHLFKDEIPPDLVLFNSKTTGITLMSLFAGPHDENADIPILTNKLLGDITYDVDWHANDEDGVQNKLQDIIKTCEEIILYDNVITPRIFAIKNNMYVYTDASEVVGPYPDSDFTGDWLVFEKQGTEFKVRAVMNFE